MDKEKIIEALEHGTIEWRRHALERMLNSFPPSWWERIRE